MLNDSEVELMIYQMSRPLGKTLEKFLKGPEEEKNAEKKNAKEENVEENAEKEDAWLKKLVVVVDADDLRAEGIQISRYFSWEKTMEDFYEHFVKPFGKRVEENSEVYFVSSVHLLVRCGYEGVFYWRGKEVDLYLIPSMAEGDLVRSRDGPIPGLENAFIAAMTESLATRSLLAPKVLSPESSKESIKRAVKHGISWSHYFAATGFRKDSKENIDYPSADDIYKSRQISFTTITSKFKTNKSPPQSIFMIEKSREIAGKIVLEGLTDITVPIARFGALVTADRVEIEGFRATARVIDEYLNSTRMKPLSIGVFGPPGSGKSFGVRQVVQSVARDFIQPIEELEVNLSQFLEYSDLVAIFHTIRDITLRGKIPIVLFDEFDTSFGDNQLGWLKYFLAPMQDANFLDHGQVRPLGRGIFIFIGGTSSTFKDFTKDIKALAHDSHDTHLEKAQAQARAAKKPDFVSRLSGYIDIRGPNKDGDDGVKNDGVKNVAVKNDIVKNVAVKNDAVKNDNVKNDGVKNDGVKDDMYTVRRAIVLHTLLEKIMGKKGHINIDEGVLNAFLEVPRFHHGVRSIEITLQTSSLNGYDKFMAAALPSDDQLSMHVDVTEFKNLLKSAGVSKVDAKTDS